MHSQSFRGYHNASLLQSPQVSLTVAAFLGAPSRLSVTMPSFSRVWSGLAVRRVGQNTGPKENPEYHQVACVLVGLGVPSFQPGWATHQSGGSTGWRAWNLAGASRNVAETGNRETKHHTRRVGELRFIMLAGPEELTLQALSPEQRGYKVFIDRL